ncbi:MAG: hypothetical protein QOD51_1560, partial [Candidatus Eremiobacteraeota bacterium]|nr:hypothetical protein [Candidatus Eremiobacteraeota bacterium]
AAGIRADRGDAVSVEAVAFGDGTPRAAHGARTPGWVLAFASVLPQAFTALAVVLAVAFGAKPLVAAATRAIESASVRNAARDVISIPPARVRRALEGEPPHVAAAIISALPAVTATAVLDLYAPDERAAIVRRLARANAALLPPAEELIRER